MSRLLDGNVDRRELELTVREAEMNRREARLRRLAEERADGLDARELALNRREVALATLANELAAERERLNALQARLLEDMRKLDQRRLQATPRWFAAPEPDAQTEQSARDDDWWAKVLGREAPTLESK